MSSRSRTARSPLRDLALHVGKSSLTVADECLRYRYEEAPDLLARMASRGELDYAEVLAMVHDIVAGRVSVPQARAALDPYALSSLARLMAGLETPSNDFTDTAVISRAVDLIHGSVRLSRDALRICGQANLTLGEYDYVAEILRRDLDPDTDWILHAEYEHPAHGRPGATREAWLAAFNRRFVDQGLLPISIAAGEGNEFDRIAVDVPPEMVVDDVDAPLVTVIMSTFKPDQSFRTAVRSLLEQTYTNLEIMVVDDCSPPEYDALLEEVTAWDPRIQFHRMPENGGTYRIRNFAIARCHGALVTFQDSDDWAHPERIARQVRPLLDSPELMATHTRSVRVHHDLRTLKVGYNSFRRGAASLMFRKDEVIGRFGAFDETRKAADTEFAERIDAVYGTEATLNLPEVLVLTQLTEGSLSREEFVFGWHHGVRVTYGQAYRYWHRRIAAGDASPKLDPRAPRPYPAPEVFLTGGDTSPVSCDVLVVSDWRAGLDRCGGLPAVLEAMEGGGLSVMVAQASSVRHSERHRIPFCDDVMRLQAEGLTRFAVWQHATHARVLVVADPGILALTRPPGSIRVTTDRLVVAAGRSPQAPSGDWLTYDPASVERNAKRMLDVPVSWLPAHAGIADDLKDAGATGEILPPQPFATAPQVRPRRYAGRRGGPRLVVGTAGLDLPRRDRPTWTTFQRLLPQSDDVDVRLRVDPEVLGSISKKRRLPPNWLALDESVPVRDFLRQLDVFVALPPTRWGAELPWRAAAALAEGAVVVADPAYRPVLGGAAEYAELADVPATLTLLAHDTSRLEELRERGYAFCGDVLSPGATVELARTLARIGEDTA